MRGRACGAALGAWRSGAREGQLLTYLRLSHRKLGLLIHFGAPLIKDGITRVVNGLDR